MQPLNDSVPQALLTVLRLEATFMECHHLEEHVFKMQRYKKLQHWYDTLVENARCRKRKLINRLLQFGVVPTLSLDGITGQTDVPSAFATTLDYLNQLNDAYQNAISVCEQVDDETDTDMLNDGQYCVQKSITKFESRNKQMNDMGLEGYLSTLV